jgi:branched-chain amino acid transport system ATP-binding protein
MLETTKISKKFGELQAVDKVSLSFGDRSDEVTFIVGPNGAGKTTFINLLTGHHKPTSGSILLNGEDITNYDSAERVDKGLVRSFQIAQLFEEMTARENLRVAQLSKRGLTASVFSRADAYAEVESTISSIIDQLNLSNVSDTPVEDLPHGSRKLVDVGIALCLEPQILLLDEPTAGIPSDQKQFVIETIYAVSKEQGIPTVIIEHDMDLVTEYGDRMIALHEGSVLASGDPQLLETDEELRRVLLGVTSDE